MMGPLSTEDKLRVQYRKSLHKGHTKRGPGSQMHIPKSDLSSIPERTSMFVLIRSKIRAIGSQTDACWLRMGAEFTSYCVTKRSSK